MFSMDQFDFESVMSRHLFEGSLLNQQSQAVNHNSSNSNSSNDYFLCDDDSITDGESFNSDQENNNNEIKEWVGNFISIVWFFEKWKWIFEFNFKDPGNFRFNVNLSKIDIFNIFDWN